VLLNLNLDRLQFILLLDIINLFSSKASTPKALIPIFLEFLIVFALIKPPSPAKLYDIVTLESVTALGVKVLNPILLIVLYLV
jgi:hypothetical protein